jgi:hypothetical protein
MNSSVKYYETDMMYLRGGKLTFPGFHRPCTECVRIRPVCQGHCLQIQRALFAQLVYMKRESRIKNPESKMIREKPVLRKIKILQLFQAGCKLYLYAGRHQQVFYMYALHCIYHDCLEKN